ncbi:MAG: PD-(D/E)XK nuclease superfamily protein [Candidatus Accumulibacter sp. BA-94]|nr:MAG: PD-(D/E)XK nuclease superfamily protein [Candidatus Accumulibacter sp. BA-94]
MAKHALMSPSSAERWMCCPGSVPLTQNLPDESSPFAAEGSCAHEVAARCLEENQSASIFIGRRFHDIVVTAEMAEHVDAYTQAVRDYRQHPSDELLIEVALPIEVITGEADARGTADAVVLSFGKQEVSVIDLKYGRGVRVQAEQNLQLIIYALAVLALYGVIADWQTVRLVIVQPRAGGVSEWVIAVGELEAYANQLRLAAERVRQALSDGPTHFLNPGEKACRWCRAKAICPALSAQVLKDVESIPETTPTT